MTEPNGCCAPCAVHSNPPGACLDCEHCHPCHLARDFAPGARVVGDHPVPVEDRDAWVFYVAT